MTSSSSDPGDLGRRSITALLWGTGGSVLRVALQVVAQIILARILGPELYGVFALALVAVLLSGLLADVGLAYGLIQKPTVDEADVRFAFTWQVFLGLAMMVALLAAAPLAAQLAGDTRIAPVVALLAPSCLINAFAATSGALLRRDLDFRTINIAAVVSYAAGYLGAAIPMALLGFGVQALVAGVLVQATVMATIQYAKVRHSLSPLAWHGAAPGMLQFGATVLGTNLVNWAMASIDRVIVGASLGVAAAGLYSTAHNLISTPVVTAISLLQSVFYSASAKVQDDHSQLARGLTTLLGAVALFIAPMLAGVAASAETIFLTLYGAKWIGGGDVLGPLALAMPAYLMMALATPVLWAAGQTRTELYLQIPIAAAWVGGIWSVAQSGSLALVGWSVAALFWLRALVIVGATAYAVRLPGGELLRAVRAGLAVSLLVAVAALLTDRTLGPYLGRGVVLLGADIAVSALAMAAGIRLAAPWIGGDVERLVGLALDRLPGTLGQRLGRLIFGRDTAQA